VPLLVPLTAVVGLLTLAACGGDDGGAAAVIDEKRADTVTTEAVATTDAIDSATAQEPVETDGPHSCDKVDGELVGLVVADTGDVANAVPSEVAGLAATFSREDGTEFTYVAPGCRYLVTTASGEEHRVTISSAADPEGIDLFDEWWNVIDSGDRQQVEDVGERAFFDHRFGDQSTTLVVDVGDRVLFVKSQPPPGEALLEEPKLIALAGVSQLPPPEP
jgi:hypothetical protein